MEEWLTSFGCDGFNIMFPYLPQGLDDFVDKVVPELQSREIFRREYEGRTLRENLGLPRPKDRFFESSRLLERRTPSSHRADAPAGRDVSGGSPTASAPSAPSRGTFSLRP